MNRVKEMCELISSEETNPIAVRRKLREFAENRKESLARWKIPPEGKLNEDASESNSTSSLKKLVLPVTAECGTYYEIF